MVTKFYNARLSWEDSMPPLAEAFADFRGFAKGELRVNRIYDLLAILIQNHRGLGARRFYPTRDLAEFFGVSTFTIATVFRRLQGEGLLSIVRGSQTMIPARIPRTRINVRGLVAMPIWKPAFLAFADWRQWCAIMQEELSRHRFAAEPVFFAGTEDTKISSFVDRVLKFNPDYILWFTPVLPDLNAMRSLIDAGVPVITVNSYHDHYPARVYPVSRSHALQQGLKAWQKSGTIDEIIVSIGRRHPINEDLKTVLKNSSLPYRVEAFLGNKPDLPAYLAHLSSQPRKGIIFDDALLYTTMCLWEPEAMLNVFRRQRSMVERHALIPGCPTDGITVDTVSYAWQELARRIALDLSQAKGGISSRQAVFQAQWRPQTPLSEMSQDFLSE